MRVEAHQIEEDLEREHAIERLNDESATAEERQEIGARVARLATLRQELADIRLDAVMKSVEEYEAIHDERLASYLNGTEDEP